MSVDRIFNTPHSLPVSESISVGRTRWNTNQCTYIDRVPVSVSEWLLGSFVLILTVFVQLNQYSQILRRQCCLYIHSHLLRNPQASQLGKPDYSVLTHSLSRALLIAMHCIRSKTSRADLRILCARFAKVKFRLIWVCAVCAPISILTCTIPSQIVLCIHTS